jgi:hypothetical protein
MQKLEGYFSLKKVATTPHPLVIIAFAVVNLISKPQLLFTFLFLLE